MKILVVYGTTEGHTRDACRRVLRALEARGIQGVMADAAHGPPAPSDCDLCVVAASVHLGRYQAEVVDYVRRHRKALEGRPAAFLSFSLSAAGANPSDREGLARCVGRFIRRTGWTPAAVHHVAGAIRSSRYGVVKRLALRLIASLRGQDAATVRDHDFTDYEDLARFVIRFAEEHRVASA